MSTTATHTDDPAHGSSVPTFGNRIAGRWTPADDGAELVVSSPATGENIARVPSSSRTDVDRAVEAAYAAFEERQAPWRHTTPKQRSDALHRIADQVEAHADMFIGLEVAQTGKIRRDVAEVELPHVVDCLRFFAGAARTETRFPSGHFMADTTSRVLPAAVGVVGVITPWNFPLMMAVWKLGPILAAGCTIVFKPDHRTPLTTLLLSELCEDILPPGTINVVVGDAEAGHELAVHPGLHMVTLTGSQRAGKSVAEHAGGCLKKVHLELGGNGPVIIDGAMSPQELDEAAERLVGPIVFNAGQACAAPCRLYVTGDHVAYEDFVERLAWAMDRTRPGLADSDADYGAIIDRTQLEWLNTLVAGAGGEQATRDGQMPESLSQGNFMWPTVIYDVSRDSMAVRNELFGPAVTVQHVPSPPDAVAQANGQPFALAASVWSQDRDFIHRAVTRLNAGEVWVNTHLQQTPELPHSGTRQSGHGTDLSAAAIDEFRYLKTVTEAVR